MNLDSDDVQGYVETFTNALKDYAEMQDAWDNSVGETQAPEDREYGRQLADKIRFYDDPAVKEVRSELKESVEDHYAPIFVNAMMEEDYETAAILSDAESDELAEAFDEDAQMLRGLREEYDVGEPEGEEYTTPGARKSLQHFMTVHSVVRAYRGDEDAEYSMDDVMALLGDATEVVTDTQEKFDELEEARDYEE